MKALFFTLLMLVGFSPELVSQNTLQTRDVKEQQKTETYEFVARQIIPMSMPIKDVSGDNYTLSLASDRIKSDLPYIGTVHHGIGLDGNKGMRFDEKPEDYTVIHNDGGVTIKARVKTDRDQFTITLVTSSSKFATLTISSRNRETITYQGEVR